MARAIGTLWSKLLLLIAELTIRRSRGAPGDEKEDLGYNFNNARRRSNSSSHNAIGDFKTKFEAVESDPVFEEEFHGPKDVEDDEHMGLAKSETADSTSSASVDEEELAKKV